MGKRMFARYSVQALSSLTRSAFNTMVDSKNNLGFSVWGANFSFTKDGFRVSPSIPFAISQGVVLTGGGTIGFDVETLSLTLDDSIISEIQGKDWGGLSIYSVLRSNSGTPQDSLAHEIEHVWQSRFAGDDWGAQYLLGLSNGHGYLGTNGFYCGNFYESQA